MLPLSEHVNDTKAGVATNGETAAFTTWEIPKLRAVKLVPVKASCTVLVPAVAPAQPVAERKV